MTKTAQAEIETQLGFFPSLFRPAVDTPEILQNLWSQTLSAYIKNPLPELFKENLFAYVSRFCSVPYCLVSHCCVLRSLGVSGPEVLELLRIQPPTTGQGVEQTLASLAKLPTAHGEWNEQFQREVFAGCVLLFLTRRRADSCYNELRRVLGPSMYGHLLALLAYVRTCHLWTESHAEISLDNDPATLRYLPLLLQEEPLLEDWLGRGRDSRGSIVVSERNETLLSRLVESLPQPTFVVDGKGNLIFLNSKAAGAFGYSVQELQGKPVETLVPQRFRNSHVLHRAMYSIDAQPRKMGGGIELHGCRKDGSEFPIDVSLGPMRAREGSLVVASVQDTSDVKSARDVLRASAERLRLLMDSTTEGIFAVDDLGCCTLMNSSSLRLLGYSLDEVLGQSIHALIHHSRADGTPIPTDECRLDVIHADSAEVHADGEFLWRKDGTCFPAECWARPLQRDGKVVGAVISFLDITERSRVDMERKQFQDILEATPDLVGIAKSLDGSVTYVNPAGRRLLGIHDDEDISKLVFSRDFRTETERERFLAEALPALHSDGVWRGATVYTSRDGREIPVLQVLIAHRGRHGRVEFLSSIAHDITALKQAEQQREAAETALWHAQKMQSVGQLAAGIAHEINTPMQYIGDSIRFLSDAFLDFCKVLEAYEQAVHGSGTAVLESINNARKESDMDYLLEEIPKAIEQSLGGIDRVSSIVSAMKKFSHPGTEQKSSADLNGLIETCITVSRNEWKYVADIQKDLDPELPPIWCLPEEIIQVVLNLIVNAGHAIADVVGDGSKGKGTISVSTLRVDGFAEIRIRDTGTGIPPEIQARIFDPFFTTKALGKGTGQGLGIAYAVVVKKHAGSITFETAPGKGTCFIVRLPLEPPAAHGGAT